MIPSATLKSIYVNNYFKFPLCSSFEKSLVTLTLSVESY